MRAVLLASLVSSLVLVRGHPSPNVRPGLQRRTVDLNAFRLEALTSYVNATITETEPIASSIVKRESYVDAATELVKTKLPNATFRIVDDHYVGVNGIAHVNFKQTANGLDIDNADFNVNVGRTSASTCIIID